MHGTMYSSHGNVQLWKHVEAPLFGLWRTSEVAACQVVISHSCLMNKPCVVARPCDLVTWNFGYEAE